MYHLQYLNLNYLLSLSNGRQVCVMYPSKEHVSDTQTIFGQHDHNRNSIRKAWKTTRIAGKTALERHEELVF